MDAPRRNEPVARFQLKLDQDRTLPAPGPLDSALARLPLIEGQFSSDRGRPPYVLLHESDEGGFAATPLGAMRAGWVKVVDHRGPLKTGATLFEVKDGEPWLVIGTKSNGRVLFDGRGHERASIDRFYGPYGPSTISFLDGPQLRFGSRSRETTRECALFGPEGRPVALWRVLDPSGWRHRRDRLLEVDVSTNSAPLSPDVLAMYGGYLALLTRRMARQMG